MTLASGLSIPEERLAEICQRYDVRELAIFGSAAREDWGQHSDVDVMVEFMPDRHPGLAYFTLETELGQLFDRRVDLATPKWILPQWQQRILPEARVVYSAR